MEIRQNPQLYIFIHTYICMYVVECPWSYMIIWERMPVFLLELTFFFRVATASKYPDWCYCSSASGVLFSKCSRVKIVSHCQAVILSHVSGKAQWIKGTGLNQLLQNWSLAAPQRFLHSEISFKTSKLVSPSDCLFIMWVILISGKM